MNVLIGMETSGMTRDAFAKQGHNAMSCDLLPTDRPGWHYQGDIRDVLDGDWDLAIFHPDCTYMCVSGIHWNTNPKSIRFGGAQTEDALNMVRLLMASKIPRKAIENPISVISSRIRKPDQIIQPYQFGDNASKRTCLWLDNLPPLIINPAHRVAGRMVEWPRGSGKMVERWDNQTDSGQNKLPPSADRWKLRSETYPGIANAFTQWGNTLCKSVL